MPDGSQPDFSNHALEETYTGTTSTDANRVDVLGALPSGTNWVLFYFETNAGRLATEHDHDKAVDDTLLATEDCRPVPADQWHAVRYRGGKLFVTSGTGGTRYRAVPVRKIR